MFILRSLAIAVALTVGAAGAALAEGRTIPTAPADYLAKKTPVAAADKAAITNGAKLYEKRCVKCHGAKGDGQGKSAKGLEPAVPSFIADRYLEGRKDGQLFWIIEKGSPNTDMDSFGPGTSYNMSNDDIWAVIAFIRSKFAKP